MKKIYGLFFIFIFLLSKEVCALQKESAHFIYFFEKQDSSIIDTVISKLENNYERITFELDLIIPSKIAIHIYPTLQDFHNAIGWPDAPDWLVGVGNTQVQVVSPLNPGPAHSFNTILNNVILHEFVHVCTARLNTRLPVWVSEGFALFEAGPYYSVSSVISFYNRLGKIPSLDELSDNYNLFVDLGGYPFSLTIFRFIDENFGMSNIREFIINPADFSVFDGISKAEFQEKWFDYVREKYLGITGVSEISGGTKEFLLKQNYPNPFNPETTISYSLPEECNVEINIYNSTGEIFTSLIKDIQSEGMHEIRFKGNGLSSGIYICWIKAIPLAGTETEKIFSSAMKIILMK